MPIICNVIAAGVVVVDSAPPFGVADEGRAEE
jgi:hypothetical protein